MSFLESIQHGLEKASQEATRLAKIQHLHNITDDLNFKASQQGQNLVVKAMEMYHSGLLAQGELTVICKQIADYQQQLGEVQEELQRLHQSADDEEQQNIPAPPPPAYPQAVVGQPYAPDAVPPGYPPYPAPPAGYPGYPAPAGYPPQAAYPGAPAPAPAVRQPTQPLAAVSAPPAESSQPQAEHHKASTRHREAAADAPETGAKSASQAGTYANGALPPIYSPFANDPAPAEPEKPAKAHHSEKKAAEKE